MEKYGGFVEGAYLPYAVYGYFLNGGSRCYVVSVKTLGASTDLSLASPAMVALPSGAEKPADTLQITARSGGPVGNEIKVAVRPLEEDRFTLVISGPEGVSETFENLTLGKDDRNVETVVNAQSTLVKVAVLKATGSLVERKPQQGTYALTGGAMQTKAITASDYRGQVAERTGIGGLEAVEEITMLAAPDLMASYLAGEMSLGDVQAVQQAM